jgi:hypothetical protein
MKASELLTHLRSLGVDAQLRGPTFIVRNAKALPGWLLQTVTAHRAALKAFLQHDEDRDLQPIVAQHELRRFGFVQLDTGAWSHPDGDERGNLILLGLIDPQVLDDEQARARDQLLHLGAKRVPPTPVDVTDLREVQPGRYRWSEQGGQLYRDPFAKLKRN